MRRPDGAWPMAGAKLDCCLWAKYEPQWMLGAKVVMRVLLTLHHVYSSTGSKRTTTSPDFSVPFRYYFCQREAIETLVWLVEVAGLTDTQALIQRYAEVYKT